MGYLLYLKSCRKINVHDNDKEAIMRRFLISLFLLTSAAFLGSCAYDQTTCPSGGCGYVSTPSYVTVSSSCCSAPHKTYVVKTSCCTTNCCPTCNRCSLGYYSGYYDSAYDPGYGYGYGSYNTGWY